MSTIKISTSIGIQTSTASLLATTFLLASCSDFKSDSVRFKAADTPPHATGSVPTIQIDTNISVSSLMGGTIKSRKPYDIRAEYSDDTFTFAAAEFTSVTVTYADGSNDPSAAALKLPKRVKSREYESHNSMSGGVVVVNKSRIIQAEFSGAITRDEPFILRLEGKLIKDDGTTTPFTLKRKYDVVRDKGTHAWVEFVSSC